MTVSKNLLVAGLMSLLAWSPVAFAQSAAPPIGSSDAVPSLSVDPTPPPRARDVQRMISRMILYNNSFDELIAAQESNKFLALHHIVVRADPKDHWNGIRSYILLVIPDEVKEELPAGAGVCALGGGTDLVGASITVVPRDDTTVDINLFKSRDHVFTQICGAFQQSGTRGAAYLARQPHVRLPGFSLPLHGFVVHRESDEWRVEDEAVRLYWARVFSESQPTDAIALLSQEYGETFPLALAEAGEDGGRISFSIPNVGRAGPPTMSAPFPDVGPGLYFETLSRMNDNWLTYLKSGNFALRLSDDGSGGSTFGDVRISRMGMGDLGSKRFWETFADGDTLVRNVNCAGALFMVKYAYARPEQLSNYHTCVALARR